VGRRQGNSPRAFVSQTPVSDYHCGASEGLVRKASTLAPSTSLVRRAFLWPHRPDLLLRQAQTNRAGAQGDDDYDVIGTDELVSGGIFKATRAAYRGLAKAKPGRAESFGFLLIALAL
jgi:hypothetical protein